MTMRNRIRPGIRFEPLPPWCGRHAGRRSNAVSACPSASASTGRSRLATRSANVCGHARPATPAPARPRERACRRRPNGLRRRPRRARTRAARESSQSRWRHEVEHHVNTRPRAGTWRIDPLRVAARLANPFRLFRQTRPIGRVIAAKKAAKSAAKSAAHHAAKTTASGSKLAAVGDAKAPRRKAASAKAAPTTLRHLSRVRAQRALPLAA
jgi:hypothetical protein